MIIAALLIYTMQIGDNVVVVERNIDKIPYSIGGYEGKDIPLEDSVVRVLDPDAYVFRNYLKSNGELITLYIGYYGTKKGGRSTHSPAGCYPGTGWGIINEEIVSVPVIVQGKQRSLRLNMMLVSKVDAMQVVYYWNQTNKDHVLATGIQKNFDRFRNRLLYKRNDGAFIRVSQEINQDISRAKTDIERYIKEIFPLIIQFWPEEMEI